MPDQRLINACPDGVIMIDVQGRITGLNDAARAMFGWPDDSLIGQRINTLVPPAKRRKHRRLVQRQLGARTQGARSMMDWRRVEAQRRDGSRFPVMIWLDTDEHAQNERTIAFIRDLSETIKLEEALAADEAKLARQAEQNALLALVAEHATDSVIITDAHGKTIWVNRATRTLSGYSPEELIGRRPGDVLQGPETDPVTVRRIGEAVRKGESIRCELLNYSKSGKAYWIEMDITPIRDAHGRVDKFIAVERDITAKKQQERALESAKRQAEHAERRLISAIESITEGFVIYDADDRLAMCNRAFREQFSFLAAKLVPGACFRDLIHEAAVGGHFDLEGKDPEAWVREQIETRQASDHVETTVRFADGRWMLRRERRTPDGEMIGIRSDITAFKQQEERLREAKRKAERAEARLTSAIEAITEGFVIYDEYDRLVMANSAYKEMRSEDADMIVPGVSFEELVRTAVARGHFDTEGEDPETWVRKQVEARRAQTSVETMVHFTDGRWMLRRERRTPQGEMIGIRSDITGFKQQEAALEDARQKAEAADRAKSEFVANISHELRTPINGIMGFTQLMLADDLPEKQRQRAEIVKSSSEHLLQLVNDLLDLSRIASNSVELECAPFDVAGLCNEVIGLMTPLAGENGLSLEAQIQLPAQAQISGDRARIKQILLNLIGNAIKFTEEGGITLKVREERDGISFTVADTGPGIPEDKLQSIFDRFSQLANQRPGAQGAGLGLAITKGLVDLMGGGISVQSKAGEGSEFRVQLPLRVHSHAPGPGNPGNGSGPINAQERGLGMYDVLVVEDHPYNQMLISEILVSIGCKVTLAENGQQALERVESQDYDLIIMDNQMPVMSGLEAIRRIRAREDWKTRIPILALTANAMRGAEKEYEAYGVEEFMTKPIDVSYVIETVNRLGSAGRKAREAAHSTVD